MGILKEILGKKNQFRYIALDTFGNYGGSMKFNIESGQFNDHKSDLLILTISEDKLEKNSDYQALEKQLGGVLKDILRREKFEGKAGQTKLIPSLGKIPYGNILLLGTGKSQDGNRDVLRKTGGRIAQVAKQTRSEDVTIIIPSKASLSLERTLWIQSVVEGLLMGSYEFTLYRKKDKDAPELKRVELLDTSGKAGVNLKNAVLRAEWLSEGVTLARDLINTPALDMSPRDLAKVAKGIKGVNVRIHDLNDIRKMKMGSFLAVARGSDEPPVFIEMHYKPSGKVKKSIAIIGKGVTFDSGGLSIKPAKSMETMKDDMSGAAAVIAFMSIIGRLAPKAEVWGFVAATENMPDGNAIRPGDVVTAMSGKTIEILNTDAEGRLTLADALHYAGQKKPDYIIDIATLTGACVVALGERIAGIMGNDEAFIQRIVQSGKDAGEHIWPLPLFDEYKDELKSPIADLKNIGGPYAGTLTAGLFLQEFVTETKWAHIDIAGPSWTEKTTEYISRGGTGFMVRTLAELIEKL